MPCTRYQLPIVTRLLNAMSPLPPSAESCCAMLLSTFGMNSPWHIGRTLRLSAAFFVTTQNPAPCGGRVFLCCGDFRQIPPVIPGGTRAMTVDATIKTSPLWASFFKCYLTHAQWDAKDATYSTFVDKIGDQLEASYSACGETSLVRLHHMDVTLSEEDAIAFVHPQRLCMQ